MTTTPYVQSHAVDQARYNEGVIYHLPMRLLSLTATRKGVSAAVLQAAVTRQTTELEAATAAATAANTAVKAAKELLDALPTTASSETRAQLVSAHEVALARHSLLEAARRQILAVLNGSTRLLQEASTQPGSLSCDYTIKIEELPLVADPSRRLVARLEHEGHRDDVMTVRLGANGLLTGGEATSTDRSLEIIASLAGNLSLGRSSNTMLSLDLPASRRTLAPTACVPGEVAVRLTFDPARADSLEQANEALANAFIPYRIDCLTAARQSCQLPSGSLPPVEPDNSNQVEGLAYRTETPVTIMASRYYERTTVDSETNTPATSEVAIPQQAALFSVPQLGPIGFVPYRAGVGVTNTQHASFSNGVLTSWHQSSPSEWAQIVRVPASVAREIVSVPAELVRLRVDYASDRADLAGAEASESRALAQRDVLRTCLIEAAGDPEKVGECLAD